MTEAGLEPLVRPVAAVPVGPLGRVPGVACTVSLEGRRPLVTEVQAWSCPPGVAVPRRTAQGLDAGRLAILVAVLDRRARIGLAGNDVFAATAAGSGSPSPRPTWPSAWPWPRPPATGRSRRPGHLRRGRPGRRGPPVPQLPRRLAEAARLGFRRALVPRPASPTGQGRAEHRAGPVGSVAESLSRPGPPGRCQARVGPRCPEAGGFEPSGVPDERTTAC
jgi:DNA repair protein RadA/Sms